MLPAPNRKGTDYVPFFVCKPPRDSITGRNPRCQARLKNRDQWKFLQKSYISHLKIGNYHFL